MEPIYTRGGKALGRQFISVGADEATRRRAIAIGSTGRRDWQATHAVTPNPLVDDQLKFKGMDKVPMAEPHQQSQDEFARDPRTWFHGRYAEHLPGDDPYEVGEYNDEGYDDDVNDDNTFHVGTRAAAEARLKKLGPGFRQEPGYATSFDQPGRVFPTRIAERMTNKPETARPDRGEGWPNLSTGQFYQNDFEDPGSVSAVLPGRESVQTHQETVQQAIQGGKYVRPRVQAEFQAMGGRATPGFKTEYGKEPEDLGKQYNPDLDYVHHESTEGRERTAKVIAAKYPANQTTLFRGGAIRPTRVLPETVAALSGLQWENTPEPWEYHNQKD
jgi:hypothetical protein